MRLSLWLPRLNSTRFRRLSSQADPPHPPAAHLRFRQVTGDVALHTGQELKQRLSQSEDRPDAEPSHHHRYRLVPMKHSTENPTNKFSCRTTEWRRKWWELLEAGKRCCCCQLPAGQEEEEVHDAQNRENVDVGRWLEAVHHQQVERTGEYLAWSRRQENNYSTFYFIGVGKPWEEKEMQKNWKKDWIFLWMGQFSNSCTTSG